MLDHLPEPTEIGTIELTLDGEDTYRSWDAENNHYGVITELVTLAPSFTATPEPLIVVRISHPDGTFTHGEITLSIFLEAAHVLRSSYGLSF